MALNNSTPLIRLIIALSLLAKESIECQQPAPIYHSALLHAMQTSGLTVRPRPLLARRVNGRLTFEHTPDFIVQNKDGETVVVCLISSYQTKPTDVEEAQACLDAYCEAASGVLINFGGEKLLWSLLSQNRRRLYSRNVLDLRGEKNG